MKQSKKKPYNRPTLEKNIKLTFPLEIISKSKDKKVCKQCSSCHGCRS